MIELRHLRYFVAVAEERCFHRAAERIHIDQTPLARTVRDLEEQLGVVLVERAPRRLNLTPAGHELLEHAPRLFARIERVLRAVRAKDAGHREPIRIGVADGLAQPRMNACLTRWRAGNPGIPIELSELTAIELARALRLEELDVGFSFGLPGAEGIVQRPVWSYPAKALLCGAHVLARKRELSLAELLTFPIVGWHPDHLPGLRQQMEVGCRACGAACPMTMGQASTLVGYATRVAAGLGVGLADAGHLRLLKSADLTVVPLLENLRFITYLLHKQRPFRASDVRHRFIAHVVSSRGLAEP
ncbi:LysR family transcriptional regulator [Variovorax sp.]|jgi:DNA-binding transcriptional LysR family regulator|uniref:LysR family transcriptional regulator n=1 Tax=Variovorax sp. TaxID=1871043 RepID=UPI0037D9D5E4